MTLPETSTDHRDVVRLRDELGAAVQTLDVPTARLTATARSEGRVVRRRRRLGISLAALAALAVVGVGGGQVLGSGGAAPDVATDTAPASGEASADVPAYVPEVDSGWWSMPVAEMETRLRALLPADITLTHVAFEPSDPAPGEENREVEGHLHAVVESPHSGGPGEIEIFLRPPAAAYLELGEITTTDAEGNVTRHATVKPHANVGDIDCMGLVIDCIPMLREGKPYGVVYTSDSEGATYNGSHVLTDDEGMVQVLVSDDTSGETWSAPVTAERPALTAEQVRAIAESPTWQDWAPPAGD